MEITLKNYKEFINHVTLKFNEYNEELRERLETKNWILIDEYTNNYKNKPYLDKIKEILIFMRKNNMKQPRLGSPAFTMVEEYKEYLKLVTMLLNEGIDPMAK